MELKMQWIGDELRSGSALIGKKSLDSGGAVIFESHASGVSTIGPRDATGFESLFMDLVWVDLTNGSCFLVSDSGIVIASIVKGITATKFIRLLEEKIISKSYCELTDDGQSSIEIGCFESVAAAKTATEKHFGII